MTEIAYFVEGIWLISYPWRCQNAGYESLLFFKVIYSKLLSCFKTLTYTLCLLAKYLFKLIRFQRFSSCWKCIKMIFQPKHKSVHWLNLTLSFSLAKVLVARCLSHYQSDNGKQNSNIGNLIWGGPGDTSPQFQVWPPEMQNEVLGSSISRSE